MTLSLPRITRRRLLGSLATSAAGLFLYTWRIEPHWLEVVEHPLPIANLPEAFVGRTLLQISDLHVGDTVDSDYLIAALERCASLKPSLTVITGDFMTCRGEEHLDAVSRVMGHLTPGPLGAYAILGNHDYGQGWSNQALADKLIVRLGAAGIRTLRDECVAVGGLQLVGLDDLWGPRFKPDAVLSEVDWSGPTLTLCHNPDAVDLPALSKCRGWILSGHTHGGQCKPPFLPPPLLPVRNRRYTSGEFDVGSSRRLYINRGLGYLHRVRFNARPEVTVFRMQRV
jgi:predicted MPP superfamily phosphohydrolase